MLGIRLCEHHQFGIGGIPAQGLVGIHQVANFILGERKTKIQVRLLQSSPASP